jgi:hypothetical protein
MAENVVPVNPTSLDWAPAVPSKIAHDEVESHATAFRTDPVGTFEGEICVRVLTVELPLAVPSTMTFDVVEPPTAIHSVAEGHETASRVSDVGLERGVSVQVDPDSVSDATAPDPPTKRQNVAVAQLMAW